jgi:hypothetical protein
MSVSFLAIKFLHTRQMIKRDYYNCCIQSTNLSFRDLLFWVLRLVIFYINTRLFCDEIQTSNLCYLALVVKLIIIGTKMR